MAVMAGTYNPIAPPFDFKDVDFDRLFQDNSGENISVHLVGTQPYSLEGYYLMNPHMPFDCVEDIDPLELSLLFSSGKPITRGYSGPLVYLELRQFDFWGCGFHTASIDFCDNKGTHYATLNSPLTLDPNQPEEYDDLCLKVEPPYVFNGVSLQPLQSNIISRSELETWIDDFSNVYSEDGMTDFFSCSKYFYDRIRSLFDEDDINDYSSLDRKLLSEKHQDLPVFSFESVFGEKKDVDKISSDFSYFLKAASIFAVGTHDLIRRNMPLSGDKIFNVINFSIASASLVSLLIGSISPSTLPDFQSAFALSSLYFGSDGLYRLYKGKKENHETPRSGIIGGLYERIVQGKKFF